MCYVGCSQTKTSKSCQDKPALHPSLTQKHRRCPAGTDPLLGQLLPSAPSETAPSTGEHLRLPTACTSLLSLSQQMLSLGQGVQRFIPVSAFSICLGLVGIFPKPVFHLMIPSVSSPQPPMATVLVSSPSMLQKVPFPPVLSLLLSVSIPKSVVAAFVEQQMHSLQKPGVICSAFTSPSWKVLVFLVNPCNTKAVIPSIISVALFHNCSVFSREFRMTYCTSAEVSLSFTQQ